MEKNKLIGDNEDTMVNDKEFGELVGQISSLKEAVEKLDSKMFGNGQPGLAERMIRISENQEQNVQNISSLAKSVSELKCTVENHIKDPSTLPQSIVAKYWKPTLFFLTCFFLIIHAAIPDGFTIWNLLDRILKL